MAGGARPSSRGAGAGAAPARPAGKLPRLLEPASIAIAGVSSGDNPGRTILRNLIRDGFEPDRITVVKPRVAALAGAGGMGGDAGERDAAESIIVIPGGLEEKTGGEDLARGMRAALDASR